MSMSLEWMFNVLVCPLSVTKRFLLQPLVCGTVFHRTSLLLLPLSPSSAHISHFFIPLSDCSLICTVPRSDSLFWTLWSPFTFNTLWSLWTATHINRRFKIILSRIVPLFEVAVWLSGPSRHLNKFKPKHRDNTATCSNGSDTAFQRTYFTPLAQRSSKKSI